jgi:hypothetical protein
MPRTLIAAFLSFCILWSNVAVAAAYFNEWDSDSMNHQSATEQLHDLFSFIQSLRDQIDRSQFDLEALLDELEYDPEQIVGFVSRAIYFEPYQGVLRGAQGTLMSRAGNSADQSLLLATLLKDAGFEARIHRARLPEGEARALISQVSMPRSARRPPVKPEGFSSVLEQLVTSLNSSDKDISNSGEDNPLDSEPADISSVHQSELFRAARAEADEIIALLDSANVILAPHPIEKGLIEESQEYFWVQWREGPSTPWIDSHPAFGNNVLSEFDPKTESVYAESIPPELQHRVRIEVTIDQSFAGDLRTHHIIEPWERPAANLIGTEIQYLNLPSKLTSEEGFNDIAGSIQESDFFVPVLNGALPKRARAFDLEGYVVPPDLLQSGFAGVFRQIGEKTEKAVSALSQMGSGDESEPNGQLVELIAHHIDYIFISPDGKEKKVRRTIDRKLGIPKSPPISRDHSDRAEFEFKERLSEIQSFMIAVGEYPDAFVLDSMLKRLVQSKGAFQLVADMVFLPDEKHDFSVASSTAWFAGPQLSLFAQFDLGAAANAESTTYRATPSLVVYRQELKIGPDVRSVIDIVHNKRRSLAVRNGEVVVASRQALMAGVWETWVENAYFSARSDATILGSAAGLLRRAGEQSVPVHLVGPGEEGKLSRLRLPAQSIDAVIADLENGFHVIVPERPLFEAPSIGTWYRVNAATGETLGMADGGLGATVAEYVVVTLFVVGIGVYVFQTTYKDCAGYGLQRKGPRSHAEAEKRAACALCALFAAATAGILVGTAGMMVVGGGFAALVTGTLPAEKMVAALAVLLASMFCTHVSLREID